MRSRDTLPELDGICERTGKTKCQVIEAAIQHFEGYAVTGAECPHHAPATRTGHVPVFFVGGGFEIWTRARAHAPASATSDQWALGRAWAAVDWKAVLA